MATRIALDGVGGQGVRVIAAVLGALLDVALGGTHSCAIANGNRVVCWGANDDGQCGNPPSSPLSAALDVMGLPAP